MVTISKARTGDGLRSGDDNEDVYTRPRVCHVSCPLWMFSHITHVITLILHRPTLHWPHHYTFCTPFISLRLTMSFQYSKMNFSFEGTRLSDDKSYWLIFCEHISGYSWSGPGGVSMIVITYQNGISMFAISSQHSSLPTPFKLLLHISTIYYDPENCFKLFWILYK